nr:hypothetical protein [Tanacetum cinerariifolium]
MGIYDFLCLPEWTGSEDPTLVDLATGTPSAKVLATSSHVAKPARSALAQSFASTTLPSLFVGDDDDSGDDDDDDDACVEILLVTPIHSAAVVPSSGPKSPLELQRSCGVEGHIRFGVISSVLMQRYQRITRQRVACLEGGDHCVSSFGLMLKFSCFNLTFPYVFHIYEGNELSLYTIWDSLQDIIVELFLGVKKKLKRCLKFHISSSSPQQNSIIPSSPQQNSYHHQASPSPDFTTTKTHTSTVSLTPNTTTETYYLFLPHRKVAAAVTAFSLWSI